MRKFLSLTKVLVKNTMGSLTDGKSKKGFQIFMYIILFICCFPMVFVFYYMFDELIKVLTQIHQEGVMIGFGFQIANFVTFLFSIFLIPSVFYFSKDSETLLSLPIKPQTILASKFTVCLIYEYIFSLAVAIPLLVAYVHNVDVTPLFYIFAVIVVLTLPVYPLILSSIISMLVMRFVPFFKNRDRFNMIGGIVAVIIAMGFSYFMNSESMQNIEPQQLISILMDGNNSLINMLSLIFPGVPYAAKALYNADILSFIINIVITIAAVACFLFIGKMVYFKGAIGFNETGSNRKKLSDKEFDKTTHQKNKVQTYMMKEFKLLIRTPVYFLNCIGTSAIMPIVFIIIYFTSASDIDLSALSGFSFEGFLPYAVLVGLAGGILFANMNLISATAISREGSNVMFMKYIPMEFKQQIHAKTNCGIIVSLISMLVTVIIAYVIFPYLPIYYYIVCFLASIITTLLGNYAGILVDMAHPKLVWEQEAAAVKQNMTAMIAMMGGMALCGLMVFAVFMLPFDDITMTTTLVTVVCIALTLVLRILVDKSAKKLFERI